MDLSTRIKEGREEKLHKLCLVIPRSLLLKRIGYIVMILSPWVQSPKSVQT